jgi:hypothetical protein
MADPIPDALIERGLDRAVALGALRAWSPAVTREPGHTTRLPPRYRRWLVIHIDGRRESMPAGAAWAFVRGVRAMVDA